MYVCVRVCVYQTHQLGKAHMPAKTNREYTHGQLTNQDARDLVQRVFSPQR